MVDERLSVLYDLMRKHAVGSISELISIRESIGAQLEKSLDLSLEKEAAEKRRDALKSSCDARAEAIFNQRSQAAPLLSQEIEEAVRALEMPFALFSVQVDREGAVFLFSANGGELRELSKCASGGELSRIMLVIKGLMAQYVGMPTMIFDEIDAGVSGSIADKMGRKIVDMGRNMQIFAITHLPQVASKGSAHYLVYKTFEEGDEPRTQIKYIEGEERVREIARMLSGSKLTEEALANARVLLQSE
jgi:DNA repair protein RecN (Recombination protein N)